MSRANGVTAAMLTGLQTATIEKIRQGLLHTWKDYFSQTEWPQAPRITGNRKLDSCVALILLSAAFTTIAEAAPNRGHSGSVVNGISCSVGSITGAGTDVCTVSLNGTAPKGGVSVALSSSSATVSLPATITVPMNASQIAFTATAASVQVAQAVTLTALAGGVSGSIILQLNPAIATLSPSSSSISFGDVVVNTAANYLVTLASTGNSPVTIYSATAAGPGFTLSGPAFPVTLNPGQSVAIGVQFSPTVTGPASGQIAITSTSATAQAVIALSGIGYAPPPIVVSALSCENSVVAGNGTDACTAVLNGLAPSSGLAVSLSSGNSAVTVPATITVPANASSVGFVANIAAVSSSQTAMLAASTGGASASFALQLNVATPALTISATNVPFGNVAVNTTASQYVTLKSTGTVPVTVNSAALTSPGFSLAGATFPLTLNPNQATTLTLQFQPTVAGPASGQVTVTSNSTGNPTAVITLSGAGINHQVDLSWIPPASSDDPVVGYKVYRSPSGAASYQQLNPSVLATATFTDLAVLSGSNYDYIVTSVDAAGVESVPSDKITAAIPN